MKKFRRNRGWGIFSILEIFSNFWGLLQAFLWHEGSDYNSFSDSNSNHKSEYDFDSDAGSQSDSDSNSDSNSNHQSIPNLNPNPNLRIYFRIRFWIWIRFYFNFDFDRIPISYSECARGLPVGEAIWSWPSLSVSWRNFSPVGYRGKVWLIYKKIPW